MAEAQEAATERGVTTAFKGLDFRITGDEYGVEFNGRRHGGGIGIR